nr:PAS domain S-box protein [uncultured Desulfobulbus sp.]
MDGSWTDSDTPLAMIASGRLQALRPEDSLLDAVRLMRDKRLSALPVVDADRRPVGILTDRILLKALHTDLAPQTLLGEVMLPPLTVAETIRCRDAYQTCLRENVQHLVLTDGNGQAMSLVTPTDFQRNLALASPAGQTRVGMIMRPARCVFSPDTPLPTALGHMDDRMASAIIAVDQGRPVGILSQRDLAPLYLEMQEKRQCPLSGVMTKPVYTVTPDTSLAEAAITMLNRRVRQVPVVDPDGSLLGLLSSQDLIQAMAFGLTDSAQEEESSMKDFLLEHAPFPLYITGLDDGIVHFVNVRAERQFELDRHEILGRPVTIFYCDPQARKELLRKLEQEGTTYDHEMSLTNTRGKVFQALVSSTVISYKHKPAILSAVNDITEQRRATEHLLHERSKLHALLQSIPDLLWVKDPEGRYIVCNPFFERFFGVSQSEILGKTDYDFVSEEQADFFRANDQKAIEAGQPRMNDEWLKFADGSKQGLFEVIKSGYWDENGQLLGVLGIARDVTERRKEQRALQKRIKEQQCLYRVFAETEDVQAPLGEQLSHLVDLIPLGWQYPDIAAVQIQTPTAVYASPGFHPSPWMLQVEAATGRGETANLSLTYNEARPEEDEGPFLHEERELAEAIVQRLAEVIERRTALDFIKIRDEQINAMFAQTTDAVILVDAENQGFVDFNPIAHTSLGYTHEEFRKLSVKDIQVDLSREQIQSMQLRIFQGESIRFETQHRHKDGSLRDITLTLRALSIQGRQLISAVWHDITDHKERQRQLAESQKRLKAITDSALDAILMMDNQGSLSFWNPAAERMLGYQRDEILGKNLHTLLAPERYHAAHQRAFAQFLRTGHGEAVGQTLELAALHKDGREITISLSLSSVNLHNQWHAVGILRDISELKQQQAALEAALNEAQRANQEKTEVLAHLEELVQARTEELDRVNEQLRSSEERYALALDASSDGLWDWDLVSNAVYYSPGYYRMLGYEPGELPSDNISSGVNLVHPEDLELVSTAIEQQLLVQGHLELESRALAKDGSVVWILSRSKVVSRDAEGRPTRALGIHTDITDRKQLESELRRAAEEQEAIFNAAASGIGFIRDRSVVRCNRRMEEIFGFSAGEIVGQTTRSWYQSEQEFIEAGQQIAHDLRTTGKHSAERQLCRKDGSLFWAKMNARPWDPADITKGLVGMIDDITVERQAAEALRKAKDQAEAATRAKSEFLANMSHEIRTPMNAIIGFAHLLKRDPLTSQQMHQLDKLTEASRHLLHIINDILDLSKIEAQKMSLDIDDFEPARVVHQVCDLLADKASAKNISLHIDLQRIPPMLRGDGPRLGQILLNLVGNAVKFTEVGKVSITAHLAHQEDDQVLLRFSIEDTGIGMTEEQVKRIFTAFEQADTSTTRRFGGTGLGLAISKQLVELMNGKIGVESRLGRGTTFWLELPFARSDKQPQVRSHGVVLKGQSVLVIDDMPESQEILAAMLQEIGMRVETIAHGPAGLQRLVEAEREGAPFALVVLDWMLCETNGITLMEQLPQLDLKTPPVFLMVTAYGETPPLEAAHRAGIRKVLIKPVTASQLLDTLMDIMPAVQAPLDPSGKPQQPGQGARILLVEDNFVNQEVAQMLLESLGMQVTVVDNGADAVIQVSEEPFDLVFMDVQMPVMDGLQATRAIRRLPNKQGLPILAMTANAFSEDRERCLQAGMNDHIAKPIDLDRLQSLVHKWIGPGETSPAAEKPPTAPAGAEQASGIREQLAGIAELEVDAGLRLLLGDEQAYLRLLRQFVQLHGQDANLLRAMIDEHNWSKVREQAHALKGAAGTLGAWQINQCAAAIEQGAKERPDEHSLLAALKPLPAALDHFCQAVQQISPPSEAINPVERVDSDKARVILQRLASLLAVEDSAANDLFVEEYPLLLSAYGKQIQPLSHQIESYDYTDGLATIKQLLQRDTSC